MGAPIRSDSLKGIRKVTDSIASARIEVRAGNVAKFDVPVLVHRQTLRTVALLEPLKGADDGYYKITETAIKDLPAPEIKFRGILGAAQWIEKHFAGGGR